MTKIFLKLTSVMLFFLVSFTAMPAYSEVSDSAPDSRPALEGYSPVSYFEQGHPILGSADYQSQYKGNVYWFSNAAEKETFDADPAAYAPTFPHSCPYNLAEGRLVTIDPTNFKIVDGQLLLFHRSEQQDGRKLWEETIQSSKISEKQLLQRAQSNLFRLQF